MSKYLQFHFYKFLIISIISVYIQIIYILYYMHFISKINPLIIVTEKNCIFFKIYSKFIFFLLKINSHIVSIKDKKKYNSNFKPYHLIIN